MESLNRSLFEWAFQFAHRNVTLDLLIVAFAQYLPYLLILGTLYLIAQESTWRKRLFFLSEVSIAIILSRGIVTELIRYLYDHARPFEALSLISLIEESGRSFPSGHAAFFFALAVTLLYYHRRVGIAYLCLAFLNGIARVAAGVHWPFDILSGIVVGIASALIIHALLEPSFKKLFRVPTIPDKNY